MFGASMSSLYGLAPGRGGSGSQLSTQLGLSTFDPTTIRIVSSTLLIGAAPVIWRQYGKSPEVIRPGKLLWLKLAVGVMILVIDGSTDIFQILDKSTRTISDVATAFSSTIANVTLLGLLNTEHRRSLRPSAFLAILLISITCCDLMRASSLISYSGATAISTAIVTTASFKSTLLLLNEIRKDSLVNSDEVRQGMDCNTSQGFISRTLFFWLKNVFQLGLGNVLTVQDIEKLDPEYTCGVLLAKFNAVWAQRPRKEKYRLVLACFQTLFWEFLWIAPSRLALSLLSLSQPYLIRSIVVYVAELYQFDETKLQALELTVWTAFTFIGMMISKGVYLHLKSRFATLLHGVLVSAIYKKSMLLTPKDAAQRTAVAMMNDDVDNASKGISLLHDAWANIVEFCGCMYLLSTIWGPACFLVVIPSLISSLCGWQLSKRMPQARLSWTKSTEARVAPTASMLANVKVIKMVGLDKAVADSIQAYHAIEMKHFKTYHSWYVVMMATGQFFPLITSPLVIAGGLYRATLADQLTPMDAFATLVTVSLMLEPMRYLLDIWPVLTSTFTCVEQIEEYLCLEEVHQQRTIELLTIKDEEEDVQQRANRENRDANENGSVAILPAPELAAQNVALNTAGPRPQDQVFDLRAVDIGIQGVERPILRNVTTTIKRGEIVMVLGSTGSGKSTFLRAFTGQSEITAGQRFRAPGNVAYCGQTIWLQSKSIRRNIVAQSRLDPYWYSAVLDACLLKHDFRSLPNSDKTVVGISGANLSYGQKCRIALARAVYSRAPTLVLDDVLNSLDATTARRICRRLFGSQGLLRQTSTTVIIATNSSLCFNISDRQMLVTAQGEVVERRGPSDIDFMARLSGILIQSSSTDPTTHTEQLNGNGVASEDEIRNNREIATHDSSTQPTNSWSLNLFYIRQFSTWLLIAQMFFNILTSISEMSPHAYVRFWLESETDGNRYLLGYAAISACTTILTLIAIGIWFIKLVPSASHNLHRKLLDTTMDATLWYLTSADFVSIANIFNQDMSFFSSEVSGHFLRAVYGFANIAVYISVLVSCNFQIVFALPILCGLLYMIQRHYLHTSQQIQRLELQFRDEFHTKFVETANGLDHIQAFEWDKRVLDEALEVLDSSQAPYHHLQSLKRWLDLVIGAISAVTGTTLVYYAVFRPGFMSSSAIGLALSTLISLNFEMIFAMEFWTELQNSISSLSRMRDFLEKTPRESKQLATAKKAPKLPKSWPQNGKVVLSNVTASYGPLETTTPVLRSISTMLPAGRKIGIVGRTGSGKSSLLTTILNFLDYSGDIIIDNIDIATVPRHILRSRITTVTQDSIEFDESIRFNLCPWTMTVSQTEGNVHDDSVIEMLKALKLWEKVAKKGGLEAKLSELGLSHGQKQLLCIARACLHKLNTGSRLVLMDEATSDLDGELEQLALEVMDIAFWDCTIIEVAHHVQALADAHLILHMENGRIVKKELPNAGVPDEPEPEPTVGPTGPVPMTPFFQNMLDKSLVAEREIRSQIEAHPELYGPLPPS